MHRPSRSPTEQRYPGYAFDFVLHRSEWGLAEGFGRVRGQTGNYEKFWGDVLPGEPGRPESEGVYEHGTLAWISDQPIEWDGATLTGSRWFVLANYECLPPDANCQCTGTPRQTWFIEHPKVVVSRGRCRVFYLATSLIGPDLGEIIPAGGASVHRTR